MEFDVKKTNMVKCIAIVLMLMHHLFGCATMFCEQYGTYSGVFQWNSIYTFSLSAKICVGIYVFLTAYGITKSYNAKFGTIDHITMKQMEEFSFNRYKKLAMNFLFVYLLAVMTSFLREGGPAAVYAQEGWKRGIMYAVFDALGLANYFSSPSLNETWWYMSIAVFMVFFIPMMIKLHKIFGCVCVVVAGFLFCLGITQTAFTKYMFCIAVGIWCAEENILEKLHEWTVCRIRVLNSIVTIALWCLMFVFLVYLRQKTSFSYWIDAIIPIVCCEFCMELSELCPISEKIMGFVGNHSMNMFLIHTLIFEYYFTEFIYGFKNWVLVLLVLFVTSLLASMIIEAVKKVIRYDKLM